MNMLLIVLVFLSVPLKSTGKDLARAYDILDGLENFDVEDEGEDGFEEWESTRSNKNVFNVETFGAVGDGVSDDTEAFRNAWNKACTATRSVFLVPGPLRYLVRATKFDGPCVEKLVVQIDGTIVAPSEPDDWEPNSAQTWLVFSNLTKLYIQGSGVIDGSGEKWWAASCKKNKSRPCKVAPTALTIDSSSIVRVKGLTIVDGQQMNVVIGRCNVVRVIDVKVNAPADSPNTDGIHITESTNVILQNCQIGSGDDCVSIVNATSNIRLKNLNCGPGHGISIGSLGKDNSTGTVEKVVVDRAFIHNTSNGIRIKTWQGGSGYVKAIRYQDVQMLDVANPIIIDQFYCDSPTPCEIQDSAVAISDIMYINVTGTSNTKKAIKFSCSDTTPCTGILLKDVNLTGNNDDVSTVETYCHSAAGIIRGSIQPDAQCLLSTNTQGEADDDIIHTEL